MHSGRDQDQYGDLACVMGITTGKLRHFNPIHGWEQGWVKPVATYDKPDDLPVGEFKIL